MGGDHRAHPDDERVLTTVLATLSEVLEDEVERLSAAGIRVPSGNSTSPARPSVAERLLAAGRILQPGFTAADASGQRYLVTAVLFRTVVIEDGDGRRLLNFDAAYVDPADLHWGREWAGGTRNAEARARGRALSAKARNRLAAAEVLGYNQFV